MAGNRTATSAAGVIVLILVGGAVATGVLVITTFAAVYETDVLAGFRHSTAYYALQCFFTGLLTAIAVMLTRPRGPLAPIVAAVSGYVALYVGVRLGVWLYAATHGLDVGHYFDFFKETVKPHFDAWDLLAPAVAGGIAGLRVLMVSGSLAPGQPAGPPFPQPGGYGQPYPPAPGQPPAQPPMQPNMQPPMQPPGQYQPPGPYQPPPAPGSGGQGAPPGGPQGGPPPYGGA